LKTTSVINEDIARSVWAVPPIALGSENGPLTEPNVKLVKHIEAGGVDTILWGGNANIYGMTSTTFAAMVEAIPDWVASGTWAIPSVGPDYGKLMEHAAILRGTSYPAAMLLPYTGPRNTAGTEAAIRDFVNASGIPAILYLRQVSYLPPERIAALIEDGTVVALKYAVETGDLSADPYLDAILKQVPVELIVSGIGEIAAIPHLKAFALSGFTAGAVCIAPRRSVAVHKALVMGDWNAAEMLCRPIQALEDLRIAHGAIPVLHTAIKVSGIVDMGRMRPHFGPLNAEIESSVKAAVEPLLELEETFSK
jgi:4-hydroxy-tetrahydrodipicolinate synthase